MNEQDGHEMLVARCKALEEITLEIMLTHASMFRRPIDPDKMKEIIEERVETIAPGCGHITRH